MVSVHDSFSPFREAVESLFESGRVVVEMTCHKRNVSSGAELGALEGALLANMRSSPEKAQSALVINYENRELCCFQGAVV